MSRAPLRVSGLIQTGKVTPKESLDPIEPFGGATNRQQLDSITLSGVKKIPLDLIDDSPYQPRIQYDPTELDNLGHTMAAAGQEESISVREKSGGRYELISGHRRTRAARNLGWTEIEAIIKNLPDREAELSTMVRNEARVDLTDYERGKLYKRALTSGFSATQAEIANLFGTTQSKVSKCMAMLNLPATYTNILEERPDAFGSTCTSVIAQLLKDYPTEAALIEEGMRRIVHDGADQKTLKGWVEQILKQRHMKKMPTERAVVTNKAGRQMFTAKVVGRDIVVRVSANEVGIHPTHEKILAALRELAENLSEL
ncbi:MAG: ParB/RepB/Spo0J family partition protein [Burkholderiaceae bacterium]